jgi:pimeloyl-ACP methyl ester carboxylesterase
MRTGRWEWWPVAVRLARHRKVVILDLPGHGSDGLPLPADFDAMRSHLVRVVRDFRRPVHLIGHSNGGSLVLAALPSVAEHVLTAVVQGANASVSSELTDLVSGFGIDEVKGHAVTVCRYERIHSNWESLFWATRDWTLGGPNLSIPELARVTTPTLVIEGTKDELNVSLGHGTHIAQHLPGADLWQPEAAHDAHREKPVEWVSRVEEFLTRHDQPGPYEHLLTTTAAVSMRAQPKSSEQVSQVLPGEMITVSQETDSWAHARHVEDGYTGWIPVRDLIDGDPRPTEERWHVIEPFTGGPRRSRIAAYPIGTPLAPTKEKGTWRLETGSKVQLSEDYVALAGGRTPSEDLTTILRLLGTPYEWGGRTERGIDCSALCQLYWRLRGVILPRDSWEQYEATLLPEDAPRPGDLAFFADPESGPAAKVSHVAVYLGDNRIVHAYGPAESVVVDDFDDLLARHRAPQFVAWGSPAGQ